MAFPILESTQIQVDANRLICDLSMTVSGDLGSMVRAVIGVQPDSELPIKPPAGPIRWASSLLELCCNVYGQPVGRAVPVGACLALLGIASSALDAVQDGHGDLLTAYTTKPRSDPESETESALLDGRERSLPLQCRIGNVAPTDAYALASNASTAVIGLAWQALLVHGPRYGIEDAMLLEIGQLLAERLVKICESQHRDLTLGRTPELNLEEYDQIIIGKTGQIDGTACEVGALLAGAPQHRAFWQALGTERAVAQQLYDDYRDFSDDLLNGRQIGHPVLYGLAVADGAQRDNILALLNEIRSDSPQRHEAVERLTTLLRDLGAEYYTLTCMALHRNRAIAALNELQLPVEAHGWLYRWIMGVAPLVG